MANESQYFQRELDDEQDEETSGGSSKDDGRLTYRECLRAEGDRDAGYEVVFWGRKSSGSGVRGLILSRVISYEDTLRKVA